MSLLHIHGFRYDATGPYESSAGVLSVDATNGVSNGTDSYGLAIRDGVGYAERQFSSRATIKAGFHVRLQSNWTQNTKIYDFLDPTVSHVQIWVDMTALTVQAKRGDGTALGSPVALASGYGDTPFIEVGCTVDDSGGYVEVREFGVPRLALSGIDTRNGGTAGITRARLGSTSGPFSQSVYFDNYYILDTLGSSHNDFLATPNPGGTIPLAFDLPPVAAGDVTDFAVVGAASSWQAVTSNDDDTSYVSSSTVGAKDLYNFGDLPPDVGSIYGVMQYARWRRDGSGLRSAALTARSGATDSDDGAVSLSLIYGARSRVLEVDPATAAAWLRAGVNAFQAGHKVAG